VENFHSVQQWIFLGRRYHDRIRVVSFQGYRQRVTHWPPVQLNPDERFTLWAADTFRGKNLMITCGISGLLLVGLSWLVTRLF